jgi:O-antigen ligase
MGSMWFYTVLRFGLFFALWGILLLVGLTGLFAALIALVLSVPLSLILLRKPRDAFTAQLQARVDARRVARDDLDAQLDPDSEQD